MAVYMYVIRETNSSAEIFSFSLFIRQKNSQSVCEVKMSHGRNPWIMYVYQKKNKEKLGKIHKKLEEEIAYLI